MTTQGHINFYRKLAGDLPRLFTDNTDLRGYTDKYWTDLFKLLNFHGLIPFFVHFGGLDNFPVNDKIEDLFHKRAKNIAARNLKKIVVQQDVENLLNTENIPFLILKGLNLSVLLYDNISIRPLLDIDIMLDKNDEHKVRKQLEKKGATQGSSLQNTFIQNLGEHDVPLIYKDVVIELHHQLIPGIISLNKNFTSEFVINNVPIKTFTPDFYLFYLCYHAQKHLEAGKIKLLWYIDILCMIKKFNFSASRIEEMLDLAQQYGYREQTENTLYIIGEFFKEYFEIRIIPENLNTEYYPVFKNLVQQSNFEIPEIYYRKKLEKLSSLNKFRFIMGIFFPSIRYLKSRFRIKYKVFAILLWVINPLRVIFKLLFYRIINKAGSH